MNQERLVQWNGFEVIISGAKIRQLAAAFIRENGVPIQDLNLEFAQDHLAIQGKVQKLFTVPFSLAVRDIVVRGMLVQVPLRDLSAFGFIPVPKLLVSLAPKDGFPEGVTLQSEQMVLSVALDRFLPSFIDVTIEEIRIVAGGVRVRLGSGGADVPPSVKLG
ncbi:MAG: hypothetical protein ABI718_12185 [Acidobacteriota bacterium]